MAKKLSSVFFSTIKRMARLQREAIKRASGPPVKRARKTSTKKNVARRVPVKLAQPALYSGQGSWQNFVHKTAPSKTELLGRLAYSLYRPSGAAVAGMPLLVMLHGCQQTAGEMAMGSRMNRLADSKGFVVIYPQQTRRVQALRCWRWFQPDDAHGFAEADAIAELARVIVARHRLDGSRVYVAGMSAGAGMAGLAALRHPGLFAAVAMHSGAVLGEACTPAEGMRTMRRGALHEPAALIESLLKNTARYPGMPALILHGQNDTVVAPRNARQLAQQFMRLNWLPPTQGLLPATARIRSDSDAKPSCKEAVLAQDTSREYERSDYLRGRKPIVRLCLVKGVGHAWSGGDARQKFNAKEGPKASVLIWQFFEMHRRDQ